MLGLKNEKAPSEPCACIYKLQSWTADEASTRLEKSLVVWVQCEDLVITWLIHVAQLIFAIL